MFQNLKSLVFKKQGLGITLVFALEGDQYCMIFEIRDSNFDSVKGSGYWQILKRGARRLD